MPAPTLPPRAAAAAQRVVPHILFRTQQYGDKPAILSESRSTSYRQLQWGAHRIAQQLLLGKGSDLHQDRIAFPAVPNESYTQLQWGIWAAGGMAVPLHVAHPRPEVEYVLTDAQVSGIVCDASTTPEPIVDAATALSIPLIDAPRESDNDDNDDTGTMPEWNPLHLKASRGAQILYTSGTTGVVTTHGNLHQQLQDIVQAWELTCHDKLLHFLPLHHTHGILVNLLSPLWAGATIRMLPRADPKEIWTHYAHQHQQLQQGKEDDDPLTLMMAVPTIYMKLLEAFEELPPHQGQAALRAMRHLRVAISGSAACPLRILHRWEGLTGHRLLERYGMTELGMALTNPLHGIRVPGYVGQAFPSIRTRLVDPATHEEGTLGELRVQGPGMFQEYWNRPQETAHEFDDEGWFRTGDIAEYHPEWESFRILGRASVDILQSGGYKISALEIEAAILEHEAVAECAVVGIPDDTWGERIVAILRLRDATDDDLSEIQRQTRDRLASYKVPRKWVQLKEIPKNSMGKVNKKQLRELVEQ